MTNNGVQLYAIPLDYMVELSGTQCALGVDVFEEMGMMIFGDSIMRNYFVAYDKTQSRIGFS